MATRKLRNTKVLVNEDDNEAAKRKDEPKKSINEKGKGKKERAKSMLAAFKANEDPSERRASKEEKSTGKKTRKSKSNVEKTTKNGSSQEELEKQRQMSRSLKSTDKSITEVSFPTGPQEYRWEETDALSLEGLEPVMSRTTCLLVDYKRFLAARKIQTAMRAWYERHMFRKKKHAAIVIQRAWRKFYNRNRDFNELEQRLQDTLVAHYNRSATIIQSLWRGWWVRQHIHDQYRLKRMQMRAAQELLHCVAFKLHHLLRTRQIPGIYSLRNSHCLSQVEKLLASMSFKQHNAMVRLAKAKRERLIGDAKKKFCDSAYGTEVPYAGPNFRGICDPQCVALYNEVDADRKMHEILSLYEKNQNADPRVKNLRKRKGRSDEKPRRRRHKKSANFCDDVIESMRHWQIIDENNLTISPDIFKTPENVENFLREVQSLFSMMNLPCHCNTKINELAECH